MSIKAFKPIKIELQAKIQVNSEKHGKCGFTLNWGKNKRKHTTLWSLTAD